MYIYTFVIVKEKNIIIGNDKPNIAQMNVWRK